LATNATETSRFVLVDDFEIAGGGIIIEHLEPQASVFEQHAEERQRRWVKGLIDDSERQDKYGQRPKLVLITGDNSERIGAVGMSLERALFNRGRFVYYLGLSNLSESLGAEVNFEPVAREEQIRRLGEVARLFADAGCILICAVPSLDSPEAGILKVLAAPSEMLVIGVGQELETDLNLAEMFDTSVSVDDCVSRITHVLVQSEVLTDYHI
jgi:bifunctional enzyme CysN/CysC